MWLRFAIHYPYPYQHEQLYLFRIELVAQCGRDAVDSVHDLQRFVSLLKKRGKPRHESGTQK